MFQTISINYTLANSYPWQWHNQQHITAVRTRAGMSRTTQTDDVIFKFETYFFRRTLAAHLMSAQWTLKRGEVFISSCCVREIRRQSRTRWFRQFSTTSQHETETLFQQQQRQQRLANIQINEYLQQILVCGVCRCVGFYSECCAYVIECVGHGKSEWI